MMRTKFLLSVAILGALAFNQASACSKSAWSPTDSVGVVDADIGEPLPTSNGFKRYSGRCAMRVVGAATPKYVQDNTPTNAVSYKSRFYFYSGNGANIDTGVAGNFFLARDSAGANLIRLALTGGVIKTTVANAGAVADIPVTADTWYSVELDWAQAAGTFSVRVKGAGPAVTQTAAITAGTSVLKDVRLGLSAASTGTTFFDEYDSRRNSAPGLLQKCDANGDAAAVPNILDLIAITAEILGTSPALGQPNPNHDNATNIVDRIIVQGKILGTSTVCDN
jgi:hypothetical protein